MCLFLSLLVFLFQGTENQFLFVFHNRSLLFIIAVVVINHLYSCIHYDFITFYLLLLLLLLLARMGGMWIDHVPSWSLAACIGC